MQKCTSNFAITFQMIVLVVLVCGCSGRKVDTDSASLDSVSNPEAQNESKDPKDAKIEMLTSALSRAQSRIEELDAKVAALADKVDATRLTVDNTIGNKPIKTEAVGSARDSDAPDTDNERPSKAKIEESKHASLMETALSEFNKAMALFRGGKYADSELAFNHFTERYPEHVLAGSAQFYAGESYLMMGEYKLALNEYQKVVASFASSPRVASAMVRIAHCYGAIGNSAESSRMMALARDVYEGNPSLDWPEPGRKKPQAPLDTSPIEPSGPAADEGEHHKN